VRSVTGICCDTASFEDFFDSIAMERGTSFFFSHKQQDSQELLYGLTNDLRHEQGLRSWWDMGFEAINWGEMRKGIKDAAFFVLVLSRHTFEKDEYGENWVERALEYAIKMEKTDSFPHENRHATWRLRFF